MINFNNNDFIGPIELLVLTTNNRLRKPRKRVNEEQMRAVLEELSSLLQKSMDDGKLNDCKGQTVVNAIQFLARTPSIYLSV
jgi:hypothetical protein